MLAAKDKFSLFKDKYIKYFKTLRKKYLEIKEKFPIEVKMHKLMISKLEISEFDYIQDITELNVSILEPSNTNRYCIRIIHSIERIPFLTVIYYL